MKSLYSNLSMVVYPGSTGVTRRRSINDASWVEFTAPVIEAAPAAPIGYDLATLKRTRNEGLALETVSL